MKIFRKVKFTLEDVWQKICVHKWISLACALVATAGLVLGIVFVNAFRYTWWFENRCNYAYSLFEGGFGLFFAFLFWTAVFYLCIAFCNMFPRTKYLACAALFVACLYCGANTAAAVICWSVWGILFACLVSLAEVLGYMVAALLVCCEPSACRTFKEACCDSKQSFKVLLAAFSVKIVSFFIILRILTAVI